VGNLEGWEDQLRRLARKKRFTPSCSYVLKDDRKINIYSPYYPEKGHEEQAPANAIRIQDDKGTAPREISELLPRLEAVTEKPTQRVLYFVPKEIREEAEKLRRTWR
jgi:hypothetical protein